MCHIDSHNMPPGKSTFLDKVLGRISRLDAEGLQTVVQRLARERSFLETLFNAIEDGDASSKAVAVGTAFAQTAPDQFKSLRQAITALLRANWLFDSLSLLVRTTRSSMPAARVHWCIC